MGVADGVPRTAFWVPQVRRLAPSLPRLWEDLSVSWGSVFSCFPSLPAGLRLPLASCFPQFTPYPPFAKGTSPPVPPSVISELRVGLTGSRGGRGAVPHALHDVARRLR